MSFCTILELYIIVTLAWYWKWAILILMLLTGLSFANPLFFIVFGLFTMFFLFGFWMSTSWSWSATLLLMFFPIIGFYVIGFMLIKKNREKIKQKEEQKEKLKTKKKVQCESCKKILLVKKEVVNVEANCPGCWKKIFIK